MMDYYKKIERSVTISADKRSTVDLQADIFSQDLNITKFILKLDTTDSTAIDLTNATVRVAMVYNQDGQDVKIEAAGIVEDVATQKIAYIMDDKLAGFEGQVTAGFYVTLSTGQRIDIQNVTFNMRKSLLDKDLDAAKESYYQTFDNIVADVQSEGEKTKTEINAVVSDVNSYAESQKQAIHNIVNVGAYTKSETDAKDTSILDSAKTYTDGQIAAAKSTIIAGNVASATKLQTARNINGVAFDGTRDISISAGQVGAYTKAETDSKISEKIGEIQVGGRNLWIENNLENGYESNGNIATHHNTCHKTMLTLSELNGAKYVTVQLWDPNKTNNTTNSNRIAFFDSSKTWISSFNTPNPNGTVYQSKLITVPSNAAYMRIGMICGVSAYDSSIKVKVELGNKPTDWSPAPEDMATKQDIATTLSQANTYSDTKKSEANSYTDSEITKLKLSLSSGSAEVTPSKIGTYTKTEIDNKDTSTLTSAKSYADGKAITVQNNLNSHTGNRSNPHGVTASQVGAYSKEETYSRAEVDSKINSVTSNLSTYSRNEIDTKDTEALNSAKNYTDDLRNHVIFVGTEAQWNGLSSTEKNKYVLKAIVE